DGFVNPVYDMLQEGGFINKGMNDLKQMSSEIEETKKKGLDCLFLHKKRKALSHRLQSELFDNYNFVNQYGAEKNVRELFPQTPPSAAGECSAPKLLQHTFLKGYTPLFISEFWWGASPKSTKWQHKEFYPACEEKCRPILSYMLKGIQMA
ncbi:MAG: tRNA pseudouridine32 synthase/23S rRNA pseudouridine746 synthase, partial [Psychromonas sp.]